MHPRYAVRCAQSFAKRKLQYLRTRWKCGYSFMGTRVVCDLRTSDHPVILPVYSGGGSSVEIDVNTANANSTAAMSEMQYVCTESPIIAFLETLRMRAVLEPMPL